MGVKPSDFYQFGDAMVVALRIVCGDSDTLNTEAADQSWRQLFYEKL
jgi:hypothetical protein